MSLLEYREFVHNGRNNSLEHGKLAIDTQCEQHNEEQNRPEWRDRHHCYTFRVRYER